ncbi:MAG: hypothetical protein CFE44_08750 [Burkholderiales bacterium PBB4]|nr:MAG: hypothetical protein CFE44_08750 [Burkholderiales bacterium PBB4]
MVMTRRTVHLRLLSAVALAGAGSAYLTGCKGRKSTSTESFVGKWKSSKLETPLYLYANGEWEIKKDDGRVLQYGIWEYKDGMLIWNYKMGAHIGRDVNPVQSVTPQEFRLREDDATTTFTRLE